MTYLPTYLSLSSCPRENEKNGKKPNFSSVNLWIFACFPSLVNEINPVHRYMNTCCIQWTPLQPLGHAPRRVIWVFRSDP